MRKSTSPLGKAFDKDGEQLYKCHLSVCLSECYIAILSDSRIEFLWLTITFKFGKNLRKIVLRFSKLTFYYNDTLKSYTLALNVYWSEVDTMNTMTFDKKWTFFIKNFMAIENGYNLIQRLLLSGWCYLCRD